MHREVLILRTFKPRAFSISDLYDWYNQSPTQLILNPKFQRRAVWTPQSKSYLINTILLGLPLPVFFLRQNTDPQSKKTIREVVDGQQRLRAVFDFVDNGFSLKKSHNEEFGGCFFSELPSDIQSDFLSYELTVNVLIDLDDKDVLDIFARLNSYGVKLNTQELINAKYFGYFKQLAYSLGFEFSKYWEVNKLFSNANIIRMKEAEFVSELLIVMLDGIQDLKAVDKFYALYDETFNNRSEIRDRFEETMDYIASLYDGNFSETSYSSSPLFYSLFTAIYHLNYGVKDVAFPRRPLTSMDYPRVRAALDEVESILHQAGDLSSEEQKFIISCKKSTGHKINKTTRCNFIIATLNKHLGIE